MKKLSLLLMACIISILAVADQTPTKPAEGDDSVMFMGQTYCVGVEYCPNFAFWGGGALKAAAGYVSNSIIPA